MCVYVRVYVCVYVCVHVCVSVCVWEGGGGEQCTYLANNLHGLIEVASFQQGGDPIQYGMETVR